MKTQSKVSVQQQVLTDILHPEIPITGYAEMMTESDFHNSTKPDNSAPHRLGVLVNTSPERDAENKAIIQSMFEANKVQRR
jgi:hypothetical protein